MKGKNPLLLEPDFIAEGLRTCQTHTNHPRYFMQWSRRFIGLKPFLTLAVAGWKGYADVSRKQAALRDYLRDRLQTSGWTVVNDTPSPL
jgi:glutamate/tyrosine decarboxylase-like PLP-dependent enzyme